MKSILKAVGSLVLLGALLLVAVALATMAIAGGIRLGLAIFS